MRFLTGMLLFLCALPLAPRPARAQAPGGGARAAQGEAQSSPRAFEDPLAPAGWKRYELQFDGGGVMSVFAPPLSELPGGQVSLGAAGRGHNRMYNARTRTDAYLVSYLTGLSREATDDPRSRATLFEGFWRDFVAGIKRGLEKRGLKAEVVTQPPRKTTVGGFEVHEQEFVIGNMHGTVRAAISGGYGYAVGALSSFGEPGEEHKSFLKSFSLRAPR